MQTIYRKKRLSDFVISHDRTFAKVISEHNYFLVNQVKNKRRTEDREFSEFFEFLRQRDNNLSDLD